MAIVKKGKEIRYKLKTVLSGMTIPELLVTMIVSGIVFLLIFDGLYIVRRYGSVLENKFSEKSGLLYSHHVLESILERTDSIQKDINSLFFYTNDFSPVRQMDIDSTHLLLYGEESVDTLFLGMIDINAYSSCASFIDSLRLVLKIGRDTIILEYGISPERIYIIK